MVRLLTGFVPIVLVEMLALAAGFLARLVDDNWESSIAARVRGFYWGLCFGASRLSIGRYVIFEGRRKIELSDRVKLHSGVQITALREGFVRIGARSHISRLSTVSGGGGVIIGEDCAIAAHVTIVSVSADGREVLAGAHRKTGVVTIGDGVLIGAGCRILPGAKIGANATVGAGSVVIGDIPALAIAVGAPARVVSLKTQPFEPKAAE